MKKKRKIFVWLFIVWISFLAIAFTKKVLQNDTFYTIKIGEWIVKHGIDMMDHFSWHQLLPYTYPHWLYDVMIYGIYHLFGFTGLYISSMIFFIIILVIVFKLNIKLTDNYSLSAFGTFICALSLSPFITARAQTISFIMFALEIYFIEMFLKSGNKKHLIGLLIISLVLCNIHVAVWPFYFILYLPYLAEYVISVIASKIKIKKENKFIKFLKKKIILEKNKNIKYLFMVMILSVATGLLTPIGNTPYTYLIKTMMGHSQEFIQEHQMITWMDAPFTIIVALETIILAIICKSKLRDLFMVAGLVLMSIVSVRHISLLSLIGTICFIRIFGIFLYHYGFDIDNKVINFLSKWYIRLLSFFIVIVVVTLFLSAGNKKNFVDEKKYPTEAVKYIKEKLDLNEIRLFNEYNYGSYLILNDIPVFIDSRADLYTKEFSGLDYDILDDFQYIASNYQEKFKTYGITHVILDKNLTIFPKILAKDNNFIQIYEDDYFVIYEKLRDSNIVVSIK